MYPTFPYLHYTVADWLVWKKNKKKNEETFSLQLQQIYVLLLTDHSGRLQNAWSVWRPKTTDSHIGAADKLSLYGKTQPNCKNANRLHTMPIQKLKGPFSSQQSHLLNSPTNTPPTIYLLQIMLFIMRKEDIQRTHKIYRGEMRWKKLVRNRKGSRILWQGGAKSGRV